MRNNLFLCRIDGDYLKYLHGKDEKVRLKYTNRPYVGVVVMVNGIQYALPLTSQTTDKRKKSNKKKRAARFTTFVRNTRGEEIADILHNNMIPVKDEFYEIIKIDPEKDTYELNEIRFIRKNQDQIIRKAKKVYDDRVSGSDSFANQICCDFSALEVAMSAYCPD